MLRTAGAVAIAACLLSLDPRDAAARSAFERLADRLRGDVARTSRKWRRSAAAATASATA